jgi:tetratricopeptide (TPR) repeat protein
MLETAQNIFDIGGITLLAVDIDHDGGKLFLSSGVPAATEDDEGLMLRALRRLADSQTPLQLQFGINRGHVFAAEVGTPWRAAYSAMGDTTNTAARICAKAPPGKIFAHPSVLVRSRTKFATSQVGPFTFKGKKVAQTLYQVNEELGARTEETHDAIPMVGRRHEREILKTAADQLVAGTGHVITITGASGLGKSRLLHQIEVPPESTATLQLRAEPFGRMNPYSLIRDPFRALLELDPNRTSSLAQQLHDAVTRLDPELVPLLALIGDIVQIEIEPSAEVAAIEAAFRPDRIAETAFRLISAAYTGPVLIIIEDAQWSDDASAHVLNRLSQACSGQPWLMIVARRDDKQGFVPDVGKTLQLKPLTSEEIKSLVITATASAPLRPHEVDMVVRRAGGNPLFAEEIVRAARDVGSVDAVPETLEAAMAAQVDALDSASRKVLRYATVLGRRFREDTLAALLQLKTDEIDSSTLTRLHRFLEPDNEDQLVFRNDLIRNMIYEGLAYRVRRRLHQAAGDAIENMVADPDEMAGDLALHYSIAGDYERTWRYARIAAARASRAWANPEAVRLYQLAAEAARRLPDVDNQSKAKVWIDLGTVRDRAGMFDEALDAYRRASKFIKDDPVARARLSFQRAYVRERAGAFSAALRELTIGQRLVKNVDSPEARKIRARLSSFTAMMLLAQEHYRAALKRAKEAIQEAREAGDQPALAEALVAADMTQGHLEPGGNDNMLEALSIYKELGDISGEAMANGNLGVAAHVAGRWDEALNWFEGDREISLRAGNAVGAAQAASNIGEILVRRGELEAAEPILNEAVRVMESAGFKDGAAWAEIQLGHILVERGAFEEADKMMARVGAEFNDLGQATSALEAALVRSLAMVRTDRATEALELLDHSAAAAGDDAQVYASLVANARARARAVLGEFNKAEREIDRGLTLSRDLHLPYEEGTLLLTRIEIARLAGREPDPADLKDSKQILGGLGINTEAA